MRIVLLWFVVVMLSACASNSSGNLIPPPSSNPDMAQITIKREFRLLGGGNTHYVYDLFDLGDSVDYNSEVPHTGRRPTAPLVRIGRVSKDLFSTLSPAEVSVEIVDGQILESERIDPIEHHERLVEQIDESLIGATLLARTDPSGGSRVRATDRISLAREGIKQIKVRQLYDINARTLYHVIEFATDPCIQALSNNSIDIDLPDELLAENQLEYQDFAQFRQDISDVREALAVIAPNVENRPEEFLYAEICGFHVDRDIQLNSRYIGAIGGFDQKTWYRPPGRMALLGKQGWATVLANEVDVEAGKQYIGIFDPYSKSFSIRAVDDADL